MLPPAPTFVEKVALETVRLPEHHRQPTPPRGAAIAYAQTHPAPPGHVTVDPAPAQVAHGPVSVEPGAAQLPAFHHTHAGWPWMTTARRPSRMRVALWVRRR